VKYFGPLGIMLYSLITAVYIIIAVFNGIDALSIGPFYKLIKSFTDPIVMIRHSSLVSALIVHIFSLLIHSYLIDASLLQSPNRFRRTRWLKGTLGHKNWT